MRRLARRVAVETLYAADIPSESARLLLEERHRREAVPDYVAQLVARGDRDVSRGLQPPGVGFRGPRAGGARPGAPGAGGAPPNYAHDDKSNSGDLAAGEPEVVRLDHVAVAGEVDQESLRPIPYAEQ